MTDDAATVREALDALRGYDHGQPELIYTSALPNAGNALASLNRLAAQAARARSMEELADGYAFEAGYEKGRADRYEEALRRAGDVTVDQDATGVREVAEIIREALNAERGEGPGYCARCGRAQSTEEAIASDLCATCEALDAETPDA